MIVEFCGVSGVGKTTIAKKYYDQLKNDGKDVSWLTYELYANQTWLRRNIYKGSAVVVFFFTHIRWSIKFFLFLEKHISLKELVKPYFNAIFLKCCLDKVKGRSGIYIFDEGIAQHLWSIALRRNQNIDDEDIASMFKFFGCPDKVISIEADAKIIQQRILHRDEYVKIMDTDDLLSKIVFMQSVQKHIIMGFEKNNIQIVTVNNS